LTVLTETPIKTAISSVVSDLFVLSSLRILSELFSEVHFNIAFNP